MEIGQANYFNWNVDYLSFYRGKGIYTLCPL
jgi:hypothetical protein